MKKCAMEWFYAFAFVICLIFVDIVFEIDLGFWGSFVAIAGFRVMLYIFQKKMAPAEQIKTYDEK